MDNKRKKKLTKYFQVGHLSYKSTKPHLICCSCLVLACDDAAREATRLAENFAIWAHLWTFGDAGPQGFKMVDIKHRVGAMQTVDFC